MANVLILGLITFLHDLFTAMWIGGLIVMAAVIMPGVKKTLGQGPETKKVMTQIKKQMNVLVWISIIGLLITGIFLSSSSPLFGGLFSIANEYSMWLTLKHIVIAVMVINVILRGHVLTRMSLPPPREEKFSKLLMVINLILGIVVLLLSGFLSATQTIEFVPE
ncbi:MAG: hypothetical protein ACTSV2_14605 [Candidatus Thorarchaeota archaeon]